MDFRSYREFFRAIAHPTRFAIVQLLRQGPRNVTELYQQLGFEQSRVSHNLGCLSQCGFVRWQWQGKHKVYSLTPGIRALLEAMDRYIQQYSRELEACQVLDREDRPVVIASRVRQEEAPGIRKRARRTTQSERSQGGSHGARQQA